MSLTLAPAAFAGSDDGYFGAWDALYHRARNNHINKGAQALEYYFHEAMFRAFAAQLVSSDEIALTRKIQISEFNHNQYKISPAEFFSLPFGKNLSVYGPVEIEFKLEPKYEGQRARRFVRYLAKKWAIAYRKGLGSEFVVNHLYREGHTVAEITPEKFSILGVNFDYFLLGGYWTHYLQKSWFWDGIRRVHAESKDPAWNSATDEMQSLKKMIAPLEEFEIEAKQQAAIQKANRALHAQAEQQMLVARQSEINERMAQAISKSSHSSVRTNLVRASGVFGGLAVASAALATQYPVVGTLACSISAIGSAYCGALAHLSGIYAADEAKGAVLESFKSSIKQALPSTHLRDLKEEVYKRAQLDIRTPLAKELINLLGKDEAIDALLRGGFTMNEINEVFEAMGLCRNHLEATGNSNYRLRVDSDVDDDGPQGSDPSSTKKARSG